MDLWNKANLTSPQKNLVDILSIITCTEHLISVNNFFRLLNIQNGDPGSSECTANIRNVLKFGFFSFTCDPLSYAKVQNTVAVNQVGHFKNQSET